jgi:hypothetical protein
MRYGRTSWISVRRGNTDVPLYPNGAVGIASEPPWPKLVGEKYRLHTLEIPEHEHADLLPSANERIAGIGMVLEREERA